MNLWLLGVVHDVVSAWDVLKSFSISNFWFWFSISKEEDEIVFPHLEIHNNGTNLAHPFLHPYQLCDRDMPVCKEGELSFSWFSLVGSQQGTNYTY